MTIVVPAKKDTLPALCYENLLELGSVTTTSATAGFAVSNCYDWLDYDYWKPATTGVHYVKVWLPEARSCDYFAIFGHDLGDHAATISLQSGVTDNGPWTDIGVPFAPASTECMIQTFDAVSSIHYRMRLVCSTTTPSLGVAAFGKRLDIPSGVEPGFRPPVVNGLASTTNISKGAKLLGRSIKRQPIDLDVTMSYLDPGWVRQYWMPFIRERAVQKPFFFSWDAANFLNEPAFCWLDEEMPNPTYSHTNLMQIHLRCKALVK